MVSESPLPILHGPAHVACQESTTPAPLDPLYWSMCVIVPSSVYTSAWCERNCRLCMPPCTDSFPLLYSTLGTVLYVPRQQRSSRYGEGEKSKKLEACRGVGREVYMPSPED